LGEVGYNKVTHYYKWEDVANRFLAAYRFAADASRGRKLSGAEGTVATSDRDGMARGLLKAWRIPSSI
jgi:hypothetical protein